MIYLTPAQLRAKDLGVDFSGLTDLQLASHIAAAGRAVNSYTLAPNIPIPHDFKGGAITGETHTWRIDPYDRHPSRRIWLNHRPVIEVDSARIYATNDYYVELTADEFYYEASEGWVEPISLNLTEYGLYGAALLPYVGLSDPHLVISYEYGSLFPTVERIYLTTTADLWRAQSGFWSAAAVEVTVNGVVRASDYTVDRTEGTILMTGGSKPTSTDAVEVSYVGTLHPNIAQATALTVSAAVSNKPLAAIMPAGLRAVRIAELSIERSYKSEGQGATTTPTVPPDAAALLDEFVFIPLAFG